MSLDIFSFPRQADPHGLKPTALTGEERVLGPDVLLPPLLRASRTDSFTCLVGNNLYLPFDVPPLPPGSVIEAQVLVESAGASDLVAIGVTRDWLVVPPVPLFMAVSITNAAANILVRLSVMVRGRNTIAWGVSPGTPGGGGNSPDWARGNRLAIVGGETTGLVIAGASVAIFAPRMYR